MLTDQHLRDIAARNAARTQGVWLWDGGEIRCNEEYISWLAHDSPWGKRYHHKRRAFDAEFIAACSVDVPAMLAEIERLQRELAASQAEVARLKSHGVTPDW